MPPFPPETRRRGECRPACGCRPQRADPGPPEKCIGQVHRRRVAMYSLTEHEAFKP
jgi:hypothetical protein